MSDHFARSLGTRSTDPDYCSAITGPRSGRIRNWLWWLAALALPFLVYMVLR